MDLTLIEHQNNIYTITSQQEDVDLGAVLRVRKQPFSPWKKVWPFPIIGQPVLPPPTPIPPQDGPVAVNIGTDSTGSFIGFKVDEDDLGFITYIHYDLQLNGGTTQGLRRRAGSNYADNYYNINNVAIKPGDQIKYTVFKVMADDLMLKIQGPKTEVVPGSGTKTVSSTNSSQGGYA